MPHYSRAIRSGKKCKLSVRGNHENDDENLRVYCGAVVLKYIRENPEDAHQPTMMVALWAFQKSVPLRLTGMIRRKLEGLTVWKKTQDRISKEMVLAFGLDHIIIWRDRPTDLGATRYLDNTSTARGKPSIVVEAGYAGIVESDDVALLVDGTINTLRALKMLSGDPRPIQNPVWLDRVVDVLSDGPGIWYPLVKRGTYVQEGMKIGFVTDYFGKLILEARAPISGVILHINAVPSLKKGDNIADIAAIAAHAP